MSVEYEKGKLSVLIVDDEVEFTQLVTLMLTRTKIFSSIICADNANVAQQKIMNQQFDLIIVDLHLPKRSGVALIETLKKMMKLRNSKVILVSGHVSARDVTQAIGAGVQNILVKPFTGEQLIEKICKLFNFQYEDHGQSSFDPP